MGVTETPTLGQWLKGLRLTAGISQSELARRTKIESSRISEIENNRGSDPSPRTIQRWAEACEAELPWRLMVRDGPKGRTRLLHLAPPAFSSQ
jgi:transcriptional regulator with XRE-family HTH domain